ncbi:MAG: M48 family metalloprotease [Candidatus Uhrbacteria bacterium]
MHRSFLISVAAAITTVACGPSLAQIRTSHDYPLQERVNRIGRYLVATAGRAGLVANEADWHFGVYDDKELGATASADGNIAIHAELARELNDDEVAAVLSHEIMHTIQKHQRQSGICLAGSCCLVVTGAGLGFAIFPWWGGCLALAGLETTRQFVTSAHSREREYEADEYGMWLLATAGYPAEAMSRALEKARRYVLRRDPDSLLSLFDSHPPLDKRVERAQRMELRYKR